VNRVQIEQEKIIEAIDIVTELEGKAPNELLSVLEAGLTIFKSGLTPFYVLDTDSGKMYVTSQEHMDNKLH